MKRDVNEIWQSGFLGFAGGVMIAASVWSLLLPGIDFAEEQGQIGWLVVTVGFLTGYFCCLLDNLLKRWYRREAGQEHLCEKVR